MIYCAPCSDGEHGTTEDGRCACCGESVESMPAVTAQDVRDVLDEAARTD